jgi:hypothetical protein
VLNLNFDAIYLKEGENHVRFKTYPFQSRKSKRGIKEERVRD